jgi:hypothetical protein
MNWNHQPGVHHHFLLQNSDACQGHCSAKFNWFDTYLTFPSCWSVSSLNPSDSVCCSRVTPESTWNWSSTAITRRKLYGFSTLPLNSGNVVQQDWCCSYTS